MGAFWSSKNESDEYSDDDDYFDEVLFVPENSQLARQPEDDCRKALKEEEEEEMSDTVSNICFDSATDAVIAESSSSTNQITVSLNEVLAIEKQLDIYEKVSIFYLLEDRPEIAIQELNKLLNGQAPNLLHGWAKAQSLMKQKWQEKLMESIAIIQNYEILGMLGFKKNDVDARFLPKRSFTSEFVNKVKKSLYFVCENLTPPEVDDLLKLVIADFASKGLEMKFFNSSYLELYLLHWEMIEYIRLDNLNNLYILLKKLEYYEICDQLKLAVPASSDQTASSQVVKTKTTSYSGSKKEKKKPANFYNALLNESSLIDLVSHDPSLGTDNTVDSDRYHIDPNNPGVCLIINQEHFYTEVIEEYKHLLPQNGNKLDSRMGTKKDKEDLESTFRMFGFKTEVVNNLKHNDILKGISDFMEKITIESSLFICIMSHGDEGVVYGVNSCRVAVKSIRNLMVTKNRENLSGKPKVLILQSCQGTSCQQLSYKEQDEFMTTDGPTSIKQEVVPPCADLFTFWATVPGYGAIRHKRKGSWFIQSLCEKMKSLGNKCHFEDICTAVINDVSSKKWCQNADLVAMVPLKDSTLRKMFFLPPIKS